MRCTERPASARAVHELIARARRPRRLTLGSSGTRRSPRQPGACDRTARSPGRHLARRPRARFGRCARHDRLHFAHVDVQSRRRCRAGGDELARVVPRLPGAHERAALERAAARLRLARRGGARMGPPLHHEWRSSTPRTVAVGRAPSPRASRSHSLTSSDSHARGSARAGALGPRCAPRHRLCTIRGHRGRLSCVARAGRAPAARALRAAERPCPAPRPEVTVLIPTLDRYDYLRTLLETACVRRPCARSR